jgi:putative lipoprotein
MRRGLLFLACALVACTAATEQMKEPPAPPSRPVQAADLIGSQWLAVDISGGGVAGESHSTLHFTAPNQVDGNTGCNLFRGPLVTEGASIRIGPLATTRRGCTPALMDQERRYLMALAQASGMRLDGTELVILDESGQPLVRYSRVDPTAIPTRP